MNLSTTVKAHLRQGFALEAQGRDGGRHFGRAEEAFFCETGTRKVPYSAWVEVYEILATEFPSLLTPETIARFSDKLDEVNGTPASLDGD